jgi:hypothetical protein
VEPYRATVTATPLSGSAIGAKTAIRHAQTSKHYKDGDIEEYLMTVGGEKSHLPTPTNTTTRRHDNNDDYDDDEIARLDTMYTNTMHGNEWLIRFRHLLRRRYDLNVETHDCNVWYRFGKGEKMNATKRDAFPSGIGARTARSARIASPTRRRSFCYRCRRRHRWEWCWTYRPAPPTSKRWGSTT